MDTEQPKVRVVIVDDEQLVRMALRLIIDGEPDLTVVAEAADGNAALTVVDEHRPDVVLMDVRMPRRDGLSATRELLTRRPAPHVLMLTTFDSDDLVLGALRAGALGFVLKDTHPPQILDAVRTVAGGNPVLSPAATARVIAAATGPRSAHAADPTREAARNRLSTLTERERETARAIADADVVIWAASLVQADVLEHAREGAEILDSAVMSLEDVVAVYERAARDGLKVARIHSGDPALWGGTQEQFDRCAELGVETEIVPGVSSFSAVAAIAGRELTIPEVAQSVILTRLGGG